ncbi:GTPase HflX [Cerasicoccus frondis]|uniref:GTPase HflX n=1 Tax=Cerasicoccus frondis TaxID=490090 RepID=UPI0028525687|nr:GTPase HflX [Cerasicoccus frondis]
MIQTDDLNPMINNAFLLGVRGPKMPEGEAETLLEELEELVSNLGIGVAVKQVVKVREPNAAFLLGSGKVREIAQEIKDRGCDSLIFDEPLSAGQQRNWERELGGKVLVIDRQEIILDIFNSRAQTKEASLQVELARLEYELPRMKRAWSHLDRQRGGGAVQRDAGETQLEMDQRMIRTRISRLKKELTEVLQHREVQRKKRQRVPLPTASIVGYTNAGKSSLLNRVTQSEVLAADKLFATLDPTTRRADLPNGQTLLMTDTVGFIRRLPHRLVEAFKATLEEAVVATFLIHVLDASSPDVAHHYATTMNVLKELKANEKTIITVFNKIDAVENRIDLAMLRHDHPDALFVSVKTGEGIDTLLTKCQEYIGEWGESVELMIPHDRYDLVNRLHEAGAITNKEVQDNGVYIEGTVPQRLLDPVKPFLINGRTLA